MQKPGRKSDLQFIQNRKGRPLLVFGGRVSDTKKVKIIQSSRGLKVH